MDLSERAHGSAVRHPWEVARANFLVGLLRRHGLLARPRRWLDVGAGDGWLAFSLASAAGPGHSFTCWDINYDDSALRELVNRNRGVGFTAEEPDGRYDALLLLDVVEHVERDSEFVAHLVEGRLNHGGHVLLTVPAWPTLYSAHDTALQHYRRYVPARARALLIDSGLTIVDQGGLFASLLLPRAFQVGLEHLGRRPAQTGVGGWTGGPLLTRAVTRALTADARLTERLSRRGTHVPGLTYWALCERTA